MKYILLILCLFAVFSHAGWFDNKLDTYDCPTANDRNSCSSSCSKTNVKIEFKIQKNEGKVMGIGYVNNQVTGTRIYDDCTIFDSKNWSCGDSNKMVNGVWIAGISNCAK